MSRHSETPSEPSLQTCRIQTMLKSFGVSCPGVAHAAVECNLQHTQVSGPRAADRPPLIITLFSCCGLMLFILLRNPTIGSGTRPMSPAQNNHVAQHYWKLFNNELGGLDRSSVCRLRLHYVISSGGNNGRPPAAL